MYFTEEHIKNQTSQTINEWDRVCSFLFGKSFSKLLFKVIYLKKQKDFDELEYKEKLTELNKMNDDVHECLLSLQDPKHLRVEIIRGKKTVEVQIFHEDEFIVGTICSPTDYMRQTYGELIHRYQKPKFSELIHYTKILNRDKIINEILND